MRAVEVIHQSGRHEGNLTGVRVVFLGGGVVNAGWLCLLKFGNFGKHIK